MSYKTSRRSFIKTVGMSSVALAIPSKLNSLLAAGKKPNIIFILADDLGSSDLSCYGQKRFKTPNIDLLAEEGMKFTQHYSGSPVCAPSRCSLLTGLHTGHSFIRDNDEMSERGDVWSDLIKYEGQRPIPKNTLTIGKVLQEEGYKTAIVGKWGLGAPETEGIPNKQGFDFFYGYLCQRMAHTHYPPYLWRNDKKEFLEENKFFLTRETFPADKDPNDPKSYERYKGKQFAFDLMMDEAVNFIIDNRSNPFFLYFAPTIPHVALQVPDDSMKEFENAYDETPYKGENKYLPQQKPRAAYAAMISRLDKGVGKINSLIKGLGLEENTLIVFTSDNGATFQVGGYDNEFFKSNGDLHGSKATLYEGGIRVPLIAKWKGNISAKSNSDHTCALWDFYPTLCELANVDPPKNIDGISILPTLTGKLNKQKEHEYFYWEYARKQQAVRLGKWKAIRKRYKSKIELYDLENDPSEQKDIAEAHPEIIDKIKIIMENARTESKLFGFIKE